MNEFQTHNHFLKRVVGTRFTTQGGTQSGTNGCLVTGYDGLNIRASLRLNFVVMIGLKCGVAACKLEEPGLRPLSGGPKRIWSVSITLQNSLANLSG